MTRQSTLSKLRTWLTVADAVLHVASIFGERMKDADIFQFAMERRLTLSVRVLQRLFVAKLTEEVWQRIAGGEHSFDLSVQPGVQCVGLPEGLYDLPMIGRERLDVEYEFKKRTEGPQAERILARRVSAEGPFLKSCATGTIFGLELEDWNQWESGSHNPSFSLYHMPADTVFVVRPDALEELMQQASTPAVDPAPSLPMAPTSAPAAAEPANMLSRTPEPTTAAKTGSLCLTGDSTAAVLAGGAARWGSGPARA